MPYDDLHAIGHKRLDAICEIGFGAELWPKQREIAIALSERRSRVIVPSCNASGKTFLAARLALAFYWQYPDAKVITTSSTETQLKDALWGEIRTAYANASIPILGRLPPSDMWMRDGDNHFLKGTVARAREGFQGIHSSHKLIIADEASAVDEEVASGINGLLSTGDARLLLIFNPTSDESYAARQANTPGATIIRINAFDTPNLSHLSNADILERWGQKFPDSRVPIQQGAPEGSSLTSADWLDEMVANGMGPGTVEWTNRVMGEFWSSSDSQLIIAAWINLAKKTERLPGMRVLGIDLAPYGDDENVIAYRVGNTIVRIESLPSVRPDIFWAHVLTRVNEFKPHMLTWDADGVGAGSYTDAKLAVVGTETRLRPFRGGQSCCEFHNNTRTHAWWNLRKLFENEAIHLGITDPKLEEQLLAMRYGFADGSNKLKVESKAKMKNRGRGSPDRADAIMYAFADTPPAKKARPAAPNTVEAQWKKDLGLMEKNRGRNRHGRYWNPITETYDD